MEFAYGIEKMFNEVIPRLKHGSDGLIFTNRNTEYKCAMDDQKRWRFKRFRNDKKDGNHISTVNSVLESIEDGVMKEDLLRASKTMRDAWKAREALRSKGEAAARRPNGTRVEGTR